MVCMCIEDHKEKQKKCISETVKTGGVGAIIDMKFKQF